MSKMKDLVKDYNGSEWQIIIRMLLPADICLSRCIGGGIIRGKFLFTPWS